MKAVYMADVGDGLCLSIKTIFGNFIQIDCGSLSQGKIQGAKTAAYGLKRIYNNFNISPEIFILSHFHIDHYNGLLYIII